MPDFLIIGAAKPGTTSLYHYLGQHPDVFVSPVKEPNFFAFAGEEVNFQGPKDSQNINAWSTTALPEYRALFDEAGAASTVGEASFTSLYVPGAAERIRRHCPDAKLIALLRDPVDRAYSNFSMNKQANLEPCDEFADALDAEETRIQAGWSPAWHYRRLGFYHSQLAHYYERFPQDQIRVYLFEEFAENTRRVVQDTFDFLGVDPTFEPDVSKQHNRSGIPGFAPLRWLMRSRNPVRAAARTLTTLKMRKAIARRLLDWTQETASPETARWLRRLYRPDLLALQSLLGRDLSHWMRP
jgi:hypothetical protein